MTKTQKQEQALNALYARVKELPLDDYEKNLVNHRGFFYSVGRKNILQVTAFLTCLMYKHGCNLEEIEGLLEGDF